MKRRGARRFPVIINKMTGFLFIFYFRKKTLYNLIRYALLPIYLIFLFANPAYSLTSSGTNYSLNVITLMNGGNSVPSGNYILLWTAVGENFGSATQLSSAQFNSKVGQLFLFIPSTLLAYWIISDLQSKTDILGLPIPEKTWVKNNNPYFYWQVDIAPPDVVEGFSTSLDTPPQLQINTTEPSYQFPPNSIPSGKHTFYVLAYTLAKGWNTQGLSFEIWVDADAPVVTNIQPPPGLLTSNNLLPISCSLSDAQSGLDKSATTLTVNNQTVTFDYDAQKQLLTYQSNSPLPEGDNTVLLKAVDAVGNSQVKAWDFIVDTQPPTGSILINAGQQITHSAYVSINIEAKDATSGVKNIYLSNDGIFDTQLNKPYPYSPLIPNWLLRDPNVSGTKTVYAKFEDFAGNLSQTYKAEINLELMTPSTRIISGPPAITKETGATFMYEASREGCLFSYKLDNLNWSDWQSANKVQFSGLSLGNHYFYVKAGFDLDGDGKITIDEEDPIPAQWVWVIRPQGYLEKLRERILFWRR